MSTQTESKQCQWCRNPFTLKPTNPNQRYCSRACAQAERSAHSPIRLAPAFWARTELDPASPKLNGKRCRLWQGAKTYDGYGLLGAQGYTETAHRHAYQLAYGQIPDGLCVMHACDVPACVEPLHLSVGTYAENAADMVAKDRQAKGEKHHLAKLSAKDIPILFALKRGGLTLKEISTLFKVSIYTVYCALSRKTWKHVQVESQSLN